jgi:methylenetetrahydrofolate dehydrogenase (NADP+)/methenyltetrahydrofolate cyclohydrolase
VTSDVQARTVILDGEKLSARRAPALARRARAVATRRGTPPRLALIAFADAAGRAAYSAKKVRACAAAGVEAVPLIVPFAGSTETVLASMRQLRDGAPVDAMFLEFPFPAGIDGAALIDAIPPSLDVDIMTAARIDCFLSGEDPRPPLTVAAALALLDAYGVEISGRSCVVVGDDAPFTRMFAEAFARRGAAPATAVAPDAADLAERLSRARIAIVSAGRPGFLPASWLADGAIAIDVGYFNPGGRGDIDPAPGIGHLAALSPVPGGIGPMTISALIERVIESAEVSGPIK